MPLSTAFAMRAFDCNCIFDFGFISVVIPVYNGEHVVSRCVASVLNDPWPNKEVVLIDDGSTDDSWEAIQALAAMHPDVIVAGTQPHLGANAARNRGLRMARGRYVSFLDCDDEIVGGKLQHAMAAFTADSGLRMVCCDGVGVRDGNELGRITPAIGHVHDLADRRFRHFTCGLHTNSPVWDRQFLLDRCLLWDEDLSCWQESEYYVRVLLQIGGRHALRYSPSIGFRRHVDTNGIGRAYFSERYILSQNTAIDRIYEVCGMVEGGCEGVHWQWAAFKQRLLERALISGSARAWRELAPVVRAEQPSGRGRVLAALPYCIARGLYVCYRAGKMALFGKHE